MKEFAPGMHVGSNLINSGKTMEALIHFLELRHEWCADNDGCSNPEIEQQLGICYRLIGRLDAASLALKIAFALSDDPVRRGQIQRDHAMVFVAQGDYKTARALLEESQELLRGQSRIESAVTLGFFGRIAFKEGEYLLAGSYFHQADRLLQSAGAPNIYLLNNLVWWLKVARGLRERRALYHRAIKLVETFDNTKRKRQIQLLLWCRPLALHLGS